MAVYTVFMPNVIDGPAAVERTRFIREGFSFAAFLFGPIWMLRHRLWLATLVWVIVFAAIAVVAATHFLPAAALLLIAFAVEIFVGLEGNNLRRNRLPKRGFRFVDVAAGRNRDEAEQRFFARWRLDETADQPAAIRLPLARGGRGDEILGLFPNAGG